MEDRWKELRLGGVNDVAGTYRERRPRDVGGRRCDEGTGPDGNQRSGGKLNPPTTGVTLFLLLGFLHTDRE